MNILIAPDKFKGSLTAKQVCDAIQSAIIQNQPSWKVVIAPLADGGEGTSEILTLNSGGQFITCKARDPLFREIDCRYGISADGSTAFIEMASASGLQLLSKEDRNPRLTSSIGTGDLIADALSRNVKSIILGCGGSATHDGGTGMASALGVKFLDKAGRVLKPIGENLININNIDLSQIHPSIKSCRFILLNDVDNPLTGKNGAAYTYARQKGAAEADLKFLDDGLQNFAQVMERYYPGLTNFAGAGAAGGFPVSVKSFLQAKIESGIQFIMGATRLEEKIKQSDWVFTGEGKFDHQSLHGKVVEGVAKLCQRYNKRLWVVCGVNEIDEVVYKKHGIEKVISLQQLSQDQEYLMMNGKSLISQLISNHII